MRKWDVPMFLFVTLFALPIGWNMNQWLKDWWMFLGVDGVIALDITGSMLTLVSMMAL